MSHSSCSSLLRRLAPARCSGRSWVQLWSRVPVPCVDSPLVSICLLPTQFLDFLSFSPNGRPQRVLDRTGGGEGPEGVAHPDVWTLLLFCADLWACDPELSLSVHSPAHGLKTTDQKKKISPADESRRETGLPTALAWLWARHTLWSRPSQSYTVWRGLEEAPAHPGVCGPEGPWTLSLGRGTGGRQKETEI